MGLSVDRTFSRICRGEAATLLGVVQTVDSESSLSSAAMSSDDTVADGLIELVESCRLCVELKIWRLIQ